MNRMREGPITVTNPHQDNLDFVQILNQPKYNLKRYQGEREGVCAVHGPETVKSHGGNSD